MSVNILILLIFIVCIILFCAAYFDPDNYPRVGSGANIPPSMPYRPSISRRQESAVYGRETDDYSQEPFDYSEETADYSEETADYDQGVQEGANYQENELKKYDHLLDKLE